MPLEFLIGIPLHGVKQNLGQTVLILCRIAGKLQRRPLHANPLALETITALDFNVLLIFWVIADPMIFNLKTF